MGIQENQDGLGQREAELESAEVISNEIPSARVVTPSGQSTTHADNAPAQCAPHLHAPELPIGYL